MRDDWYGHREPYRFDEVGDKDEWISWDHALADALQTIEDATDDSGIPAWELEDPAVVVYANKKIHKFREAVDQATTGTEKKPYKKSPGEYFVPEVVSRRSDDSIWTYSDWIKSKVEDSEIE